MSTIDLIRAVNPWWKDAKKCRAEFKDRRHCFSQIEHEALVSNKRHSVVLLGPRRVGKTVALMQLVEVAIEKGHFPASNVCFVDMDRLRSEHRPIEIVEEFMNRQPGPSKPCLFLFDEIQGCMDWEKDIKYLTDHVRNATVVVSGSIASALKRKSDEVGLGRFQHIRMPPVSFCEFLEFRNWPIELSRDAEEILTQKLSSADIARLNHSFMEYMNYGGYPQLIFDEDAAKDPYMEIKIQDEDMFGKSIHLYGISSNNGLYELLFHIARNNGKEMSLSKISQKSGKNVHTMSKYIKFLQAAFLIRKIDRLGLGLQKFQRDRGSKYILENPSMQKILTHKVITENNCSGHTIEATTIAQYQAITARNKNHFNRIYYSRYSHHGKSFEVDMVHRTRTDEIVRLAEIKWSDSKAELDKATRNLEYVLGTNTADEAFEGMYCTTKSSYHNLAASKAGNNEVRFIPTAQYCLALGLDARTLVTHDGHGVQKHSRAQPEQSKPS